MGWRLIPDWPGYQIDGHGSVRSLPRESYVVHPRWGTYRRMIKGKALLWVYPGRTNSPPYPAVNLCRNGTRASVYVHKLVAQAFLEPQPGPGHQIRHLDGDAGNPAAWNLAWGTVAQNTADRVRHGTYRNNGSRILRHRMLEEVPF